MRRWVLVALVSGACIEQTGLGPDIGACADLPDGPYRYGEVGIGTCIAGPADLRFFEQGSKTWLAVSNADPYRSYATGSVLLIDWDSLSDDLDAAVGLVAPPRMLMSDVSAVSLAIADDDNDDGVGENAWLGQLGYLEGYQRLVVPSRLSENSNIRLERDELFVVDTSGLDDAEPTLKLSPALTSDTLRLHDDPFPVVTDPDRNRFFVGNLTDRSISVLRAGETPRIVDIAGAPDFAGDLQFSDIDASGSVATISDIQIVDEDDLRNEAWTLQYIDATVMLFAPSQEIVQNKQGVDLGGPFSYLRWRSQGSDWEPSAFGTESGLTGIADPVFATDSIYGATVVGVRQSDNAIVLGASPVAGSWGISSTPLLGSPPGVLQSSPSVTVLPGGLTGLFYDLQAGRGAPGSIGLAVSADDLNYDRQATVLAPPTNDDGIPVESYEDPFVYFDALRQGWRMYLTRRLLNGPGDSDDTWEIALSQSDDGRLWGTPVTVLSGADPMGAPMVRRLGGRYVMWLSVWDGTGWNHASSWSWDGWQWTDPDLAIPGDVDPLVAGVPSDPPRPGVLVEAFGSWRVSGRDFGIVNDTVLYSGTGLPGDFGGGYTVTIAQGQEIPNHHVPDLHAARGLVPDSVVEIAGRKLLYATAEGFDGRRRIAILEEAAGEWTTIVTPAQVDGMLRSSEDQDEVLGPVVVENGDDYVMLYTRRAPDGTQRTARATSADGLTWAPSGDNIIVSPLIDGFDAVGRRVSSVQEVDGTYRLWLTGNDGTTLRIGYATGSSLTGDFEIDPSNPVQLDVGPAGSFDARSVKAPLALDIDGTTHLYYAGFGPLGWSIGHASFEGEAVQRRLNLDGTLTVSSLPSLPRTFAAQGADHPVLLSQSAGELELLFAGHEFVDETIDTLDSRDNGMIEHVGRAVVNLDYPAEIYATQRFPTVGDELTFRTAPGGDGAQVIELLTQVGDFSNAGTGMTSMTLDADRGFIYVTLRDADQVMIVDVRDDTAVGFDDANHFDVEGVLDIEARSTSNGFMSSMVIPSRDQLALTMRQPEALVLVDLTQLVDDDDKEVTRNAAVTFLPMQDNDTDAGTPNFANIGGTGMALSSDEGLLLATHFNGNAVSVFDLRQGAWGQEIAWIRDVGEAPHVIRTSPDGRWAVVANYIGEVEEDFATNGILAIVSLDPAHERYLEVAAWLVNR